ncbi:MAG: alpha/beta fold hydrolase [Candidatus Rokubacteria bacterium]|nr:alpha/beta fold hydrolase [Candidatus Rokubacteria bacterium]
MACPRCEHETPPDAEFCPECGAKLVTTCAQCGTTNAAAHKFCKKCGRPLAGTVARQREAAIPPKHLAEKILVAKGALEGERKQVTVLFADLKGSMELLADRDPEEARKLLDPVLERMMEAVHRYEGTVNQVMGDGIMALFGAPLAHEDHAVRASYAALHMQEAVRRYAEDVRRAHGIEVQIRVGLNSGEVVVRSIGSDLHMDYTAVGQTTHLAARMEQLATPGSVRMTGRTLRLAEGYVQVRPLGPIPVKGVPEPVEVYELTGAGPARTRLQAAAVRGLSRFVGRDAEMEQLRRAWDQAARGRGQIVAVVGEPGVGKSRLFHEFTHSHRTHDWLVLESGAVPYGKQVPYLPVTLLLKSYFQIDEGDGARRSREKVTGKILILDENLKDAIPPILALLEALPAADPFRSLALPLQRGRTLGALKQLVLRESQRQPLCVLVEDLHWLDSESQAALDLLVDSVPAQRILLLTNYRPEYEDRWAAKTYHTRLRIDPLPQESAEVLLDSLLGEAAALAPLKALVKQRSGGNPLFIEESVRAFAEEGVVVGRPGAYRLQRDVRELQVPATVQALLAARIDRLATEERQLLQCAAVIGTDVPLPLLQAIADVPEDALQRLLTRLQAAEFLYETRLFPEPEYMFKHTLTHDVAYAGVLQERRRLLHRRLGEVIEQRYADRLPEFCETLADHFVRGEVWERAGGHYLRAGEKAVARHAYQNAAGFCARAVQIAESHPGLGDVLQRGEILLGDLWSLMDDAGRANTSYERALDVTKDPAKRRFIENKRHRLQTVVRDGAKIAFYEHGSGDETLVLANPVLYGIAIFQPLLDRLCQDFRVITIDCRGAGESDPLTRPYSLQQHMEDVRAVIQAVATEPVIGVGVSRGGNLLIQLVTTHPGLVKKMVLVGTSLSWERPEAQEVKTVAQRNLEAAVRLWFSRVYTEPGTENLADQFIRRRLQLPAETILSFFDSDPTYEIASLLPRIHVPTLVTRGTNDRASSAEDARTLVERIPGARFYAFEGKGHVPIFTATDEFCEVLRAFVRTGAVPVQGR